MKKIAYVIKRNNGYVSKETTSSGYTSSIAKAVIYSSYRKAREDLNYEYDDRTEQDVMREYVAKVSVEIKEVK